MEQIILYKNHPVYYRTTGSGDPVILIHGFGEDGEVWKQQATALESICRLIIPDLPGSGKSNGWEDVSMDEMAEVIKGILDAEKAETATLIGHSMGGYITLAFAEKYQLRVKSFCLFHSSAYADSDEKKEARRKSIEFIKKNGSYAFLKQSVPNLFSPAFKEKTPEIVSEMIEQYRDFSPEALIAYYEAMMERPDRTHVLQEATYPVQFILGKHDQAIPLQDGLSQCHLPVISYIHILEESGHMGLWEQSSESNRVLEDFLVRK